MEPEAPRRPRLRELHRVHAEYGISRDPLQQASRNLVFPGYVMGNAWIRGLLPPIARSTVLEVPGELVSSAVNTIEDVEQLKVLLKDLAQDNAADVCPSAVHVVRIPAALTPPGLHTTEGAEELAILPQDLAQDATGVFRPAATLVTWLVRLRHLPTPTSEKTRKNFCTSGWLSARLTLVSQAF
ncbi:hypothetical protein V5799_012735 [Amblyomma americanum]|uniref:Uncharacterized protein n=1 Tax=Amblyomma americanum TaxID=6943 RepID=A0AAQ4E808_AMBAM